MADSALLSSLTECDFMISLNDQTFRNPDVVMQGTSSRSLLYQRSAKNELSHKKKESAFQLRGEDVFGRDRRRSFQHNSITVSDSGDGSSSRRLAQAVLTSNDELIMPGGDDLIIPITVNLDRLNSTLGKNRVADKTHTEELAEDELEDGF